MKRLLFTAGTMAALVLASCSNDEINNLSPTTQGLIRYNAVMNSSTRANTLYEAGSHPDFYVYATSPSDNNKTYIKGDAVTYNTASGDYTYNQRYWPTGGAALNFFAFSGNNHFGTTNLQTANVVFNEDNTDSNLKIGSVAIPPYAKDQIDMLYAVSKDQTGKDSDDKEIPVPLYFRHALAQLNFQFVNKNPNIQVKVREVRICGIKNVGDVVYKYVTNTQYREDGTGTQSTLYDLDPTAGSTGSLCEWSNLDAISPNRAWNDVTRDNWQFADLAASEDGVITLTGTPQQLKADGAPKAEDYFTLITSYENDSEDIVKSYLKGAKDQYEKDWKEGLQAGVVTEANVEGTDATPSSNTVMPDQDDIDVANATEEEILQHEYNLGAQDQYVQDYLTSQEWKKYATDIANYNNQTQKTFQAVYVIPQETVAGKVDKAKVVDGKTTLGDVEGMYFLIKCQIVNIADGSGTPSEDDVVLYPKGSDSEYAYVYVPLRAEDYNVANGTDDTEEYIKSWKAGRKYIYTFYFGEKGSNGGLPVIDPDEPDKPDPDPDDPSVIDEEDPALRLITYTAASLFVDDYQTYEKDDVDATYDKTKDEKAEEQQEP